MVRKLSLFIFVSLVLTSSLWAQGYGRGRGAGAGGNFGTICAQMPAQNVDAKEKAALVYMREEEKLARDVYLSLYQKWNFMVFNNIASSESKHTEAVKLLLDKYKIDDPIKNDAVGAFTNKELAKLYRDLVVQGEKSLKDALVVGATIEDLDIADLKERLAETDNDDIKCVFENLTRGSENHIRAFVGQLKLNGGTYKAQYISQDELDKILQEAPSKGHGGGMRGRRF